MKRIIPRMTRRTVLVPVLVGSTLAVVLLPVIFYREPSTRQQTFTLMIRTAAHPDLMYQFYCLFLRTAVFFWPAGIANMVLILDHESVDDRRFGYKLLKQVTTHYPEIQLGVAYEREPRNDKIWKFSTARSQGYNRQLYSTFISDTYTNSDVIVYMDADVQFRVPITLKYLMNCKKLKVFGNTPQNTYWMDMWANTTEYAIGVKLVANFMVTFPQIIYRDTITNCRNHILKRHNVSNIEQAIQQFYGPDKLISPINIIMNYAWYFEKAKYDWHLAIADVDQTNERLPPEHRILPTDTMPSIVGVPHSIDKKWDASMMLPGYCTSMAAINRPVAECQGITHDFKRLCHFNLEHHRFRWPGLDHWCEEGELSTCCEKNTHEHYVQVAAMYKAGFFHFNKTKPEFVQNLAKEMGVQCEPLRLP